MNRQRLILGAVLVGLVSWAGAAQVCLTSIPASTPTADFAINTDGTVTHLRTGLMWMRCSLGQTWTGSTCACPSGQKWDGVSCAGSTGITWQQALLAAKGVNDAGGYAGRTDWRVPNIKELASIVEWQCAAPAINSGVFPNTAVTQFWSASASPTNAWNAEFGGGMVGQFYIGSARGTNSGRAMEVRLVRAGETIGNSGPAVPFAMIGTPSGDNSNLTLLANFTIASADAGRTGGYYIAAMLATGELFFLAPSGFTQYLGGAIPTFYTGILSSRSMTVLSGLNVSPYLGTTIFAGYGLDEADLVGNRKFSVIHTIQ